MECNVEKMDRSIENWQQIYRKLTAMIAKENLSNLTGVGASQAWVSNGSDITVTSCPVTMTSWWGLEPAPLLSLLCIPLAPSAADFTVLLVTAGFRDRYAPWTGLGPLSPTMTIYNEIKDISLDSLINQACITLMLALITAIHHTHSLFSCFKLCTKSHTGIVYGLLAAKFTVQIHNVQWLEIHVNYTNQCRSAVTVFLQWITADSTIMGFLFEPL